MASPTEPIAPELLALLRCPETMQVLAPASAELLERVWRERLKDRSGQEIAEPLEGGLLRSDGRLLFPIRGGIPVLLLDQAIPV